MKGELTGIDLRADEHKEVVRLLQHHLPDTEVWAYGSRVKGTARPASDLDLVTFASAGQKEAISRLREAFDESPLPFRVDLFVWDKAPEEFRKNIEETRVVVQKEKTGGKLPEGWKETTIGEFCPFSYGKNLPKKVRDSLGEVPVFGSNGVVGHHAKPLIQDRGIIIGRKGTVGTVTFSSVSFWPIDTTFYISEDSHRDLRYTFYLLKSLRMEHMNADSAVPGLNRNAAHARKITIPPLPEQKAIAHILGSLDDKIELNRRMNETLEAMAQALFKSWFVDFDPVIDNALAAGNTIPDELKEKAATRQGLDDKQKSLPDDIRRLFPSEFAYTEEMGWIPKGWTIGPLGLIATYCSDRMPTSELTLENYISTENMLAEKKGICTAAKLPTVKTTSSYQSGNVLVSNIRPYFKKIWFADGSGGCSNDILNFTVKELNTEEYLLNLLWQDTFFDYMMTTAKGSKMPRSDKDAIMNWKVIIPPVESRRLFAETIRGFYKQISGKYKINDSLCIFSDKLLTRLLSGEIRIKQAEHTLRDRS